MDSEDKLIIAGIVVYFVVVGLWLVMMGVGIWAVVKLVTWLTGLVVL